MGLGGHRVDEELTRLRLESFRNLDLEDRLPKRRRPFRQAFLFLGLPLFLFSKALRALIRSLLFCCQVIIEVLHKGQPSLAILLEAGSVGCWMGCEGRRLEDGHLSS